MLTEPGTLDRIADALDQFPKLTPNERAHIFHAIDTAPSPASWRHAKEIDLAGGVLLKPYTLAEAVRWNGNPDAAQIMAGLNYAAGYVR